MPIKKRVFKPAGEFVRGCSFRTWVDRWEWTPSRGLRCIFRDGLNWKSEYTLPELLAIEKPIEIKGGLLNA